LICTSLSQRNEVPQRRVALVITSSVVTRWRSAVRIALGGVGLAVACSTGTGGSGATADAGNWTGLDVADTDVATEDDVRAMCAAACNAGELCNGTASPSSCIPGCEASLLPLTPVLSRSALAMVRDCRASCTDAQICDDRVRNRDADVAADLNGCLAYLQTCPTSNPSLCLQLAAFRPEPRQAVLDCYPQPCEGTNSMQACIDQVVAQ
jgi:hypothetical protein